MKSKTVAAAAFLAALAASLPGTAHALIGEDSPLQLRGAIADALQRMASSPLGDAMQAEIAALARDDGTFAGDAAGVAAFYEANGYQPVWFADGTMTAAARAAIARIRGAAADGLDPSAYALPVVGNTTSVASVAAREIRMSLAVVAYTREAYAGRLDPRALNANLDITPHLPDAVAALANVSSADDAAAALDAYNPTHPGYVALRDELARIRGAAADERIVVPEGPTLRLGSSGERVTILRARLDLPAPVEGAEIFDESLDVAVRDFQAANGLITDGVVGPNTLGALNGPAIDPVGEIIANMERYRWLPRDLGEFYVQVNVPEYMLRVFRDGVVIHETRVVTGLRSHQTPIFSDEIEHVIVNPYWNVPASIIAEEYYAMLRSDPGYFNRAAFDVWVRWEGRTHHVDPVTIDWSQISPSMISMRQRPGNGNALGRVKFMFPNNHAVYLHDTPSKSLFDRDARAFSHGCVRVMNPMDFADVLLMDEPGWDAAALEALYGPNERQVDLTHHIPVHITYFTAVVDENGNIQFRNDVYGHSALVRAALGLAPNT